MAAFSDGQNHVEATLVEGRGKAGLWRFDFMGSKAIAPGSIRVLAGDIASVPAASITFHLKGTPGERIAFTFDKKGRPARPRLPWPPPPISRVAPPPPPVPPPSPAPSLR